MPTTLASLSEELLTLKEDSGWSWNEMANQVEYALEMKGPSGSSLFRYAKGQAHPSGMVEQTVLTAIQRIREQQMADCEEDSIEVEEDSEIYESTREISEVAEQIAVANEIDDEELHVEESVIEDDVDVAGSSRVSGISGIYALEAGWVPAEMHAVAETIIEEEIEEDVLDEISDEPEMAQVDVIEDVEEIAEVAEIDGMAEVSDVDETAEILDYTHTPAVEEIDFELRSLDWAIASIDLDDQAQAVTGWSQVAEASLEEEIVEPRVISVGIATEAQVVTAYSMVGQHVIENAVVYEPRVISVGISEEAQATTALSMVGQHVIENTVVYEPRIISVGIPLEAQAVNVWSLVAESVLVDEVVEEEIIVEEPVVFDGPEVVAEMSDEIAVIADAFASFTSYESEHLADLANYSDVVAPGVFINSAVETEAIETSEVQGKDVEEVGSADVVEEVASIEIHLSLYAHRNGVRNADPDVVVKAPMYSCRSREIIFSPVAETES
jgi:hypothetical protein